MYMHFPKLDWSCDKILINYKTIYDKVDALPDQRKQSHITNATAAINCAAIKRKL